MSQKFEVGDVVVCTDDSPYAGFAGFSQLNVGRAYEVARVRGSGDVCLVGVTTGAWMHQRFRRATLGEIRKYRKEQGYEKHHFAVGDLVVCIVEKYDPTLFIGQVYTVSASYVDGESECFVDIDGGKSPGRYFAANFRKATPAEAEAYRKDKEKASYVAGEEIKPGQLVTVSIGDKPPFKAVVLEAPTASDPFVKLSRAAGIDWASAEAGPSFNVTFTWEGPEKMPLTGNDAPETINKAIAVPNPQMLTSSDGREFEIIDWRSTVRTGEVVTVEAKLLPLAQKPFEALKAAVAAPATTKPAAPAWQPKPGDLVVCKDAEHSTYALEAGKVYAVAGTTAYADGIARIVLQGTSLGVGRACGWYSDRFRPATVTEIYEYHKPRGSPDHQFKIGDVVVVVDARTGAFPFEHPVGSVFKVLDTTLVGTIAVGYTKGTQALQYWNATRFRKATPLEIAEYEAKKAPAEPAWQPKPGDLVVCIDVSVSTLRLGGVYEVGTGKNGDLLPLKGSSISMPLERNTVFYRLSSFRPATPEEICDYHKEKGFPDHQFNVGDIVVAVDVRVADGTLIAPDFAVGSVHEVLYRSGIGIRVSGCDRQGFWNLTRFRKATDGERIRFFNEKLDKEGPGDGYRLLGDDERIDENDEVFDAEKGTWVPTIRAGETAGTGPNRYRRRNKFAEGELVQIVKPATEQERAKWPGWYSSMDGLDAKAIPMPRLADTDSSRLRRRPIIEVGCGDSPATWQVSTDWLAPATKAQKKAYEDKEKAKKAKIQELEDKMKDIQSELSSLKGT